MTEGSRKSENGGSLGRTGLLDGDEFAEISGLGVLYGVVG